jgi:CubicO group peptidase (beta-lactamase class C family)
MGDVGRRNLLTVNNERRYHSKESTRYGEGNKAHNSDTTAAQPPVDPAWLAATLSALADNHQVPGAQLAIHHDGVTVAVETGEIEHETGTPVTRQTAFPIGSLSKAWTATLAMILVADGDLELDAPLDMHLPELGDLGRQLTLRQLLSHTSGFACSPNLCQQSPLPMDRYVRQYCRAQDLIFPPGTGFSYSNRNYVVIGHLIETITGMSWSEAMESILLQPLNIDLASIVGTTREFFGRSIATGHSTNTVRGRTEPVQQLLALAEAPAGALAMSAVDLVALGLMHVGPGFPELLPASYAQQMRQAIPVAEPFGLADGWGSGLAVFRDGTTDWAGHDGNANGTSCHLRIDPANGCVVALTTNANTGSYLWDELRIELARANLSLGTPRRHMSSRAPATDLTEFVGSYSNGPIEYLVSATDDGTLCLTMCGDVIARLAFFEDLDFLIQNPLSGEGRHVGRFLRDPITQQVELLQIGGRLATRRLSTLSADLTLVKSLGVPITNLVPTATCSTSSRGHSVGGLR